jgi:1,2-dihydroxy-3-keto-5-methylthiopentene dioxygenase
MGRIIIADENRQIEGIEAMRAFLKPFNIRYERWPLEERVDPNAPPADILAAYAPEIDQLKAEGGFVTADVINVTPEMPNLEPMLEKFRKEHTHSEDEVRFILRGRGLFHIHPDNGPVFAIQVEAGDLISVPLGTKHWFDLCGERIIRAIRLFQDTSGWTPHYIENGAHSRYEPVCFGPAWVAGVSVEPAVRLQ